jgi:hypothetical protein
MAESSALAFSSSRRRTDLSQSKMPPQQGDRLLDFVDGTLDFGAHGGPIRGRGAGYSGWNVPLQMAPRGAMGTISGRAKRGNSLFCPRVFAGEVAGEARRRGPSRYIRFQIFEGWGDLRPVENAKPQFNSPFLPVTTSSKTIFALQLRRHQRASAATNLPEVKSKGSNRRALTHANALHHHQHGQTAVRMWGADGGISRGAGDRYHPGRSTGGRGDSIKYYVHGIVCPQNCQGIRDRRRY